MGAGIFLPIAIVASSFSSAVIIKAGQNVQGITDGDIPDSWTPPQYSKPALTILTVPGSISGSSGQSTSSQINYVFDAVLKLSHTRVLRKTQHPVLTGANISDHAYVEPARVVLEIGMSDAMASFADGIWVGAATKSVSAWQILKILQINKTLLTLSTRLDVYYNMLIESMVAPDDNRTLHALRATIVLGEIIAASVSSTQAVSARPQTSDSSPAGTTQSVVPSQAQVQQNVIPSPLWPNTPTFPNVPGAGVVSSNSLGQVPTE